MSFVSVRWEYVRREGSIMLGIESAAIDAGMDCLVTVERESEALPLLLGVVSEGERPEDLTVLCLPTGRFGRGREYDRDDEPGNRTDLDIEWSTGSGVELSALEGAELDAALRSYPGLLRDYLMAMVGVHREWSDWEWAEQILAGLRIVLG